MLLAKRRGFENLIFLPLWFAFFDGSIVFLDLSPSFLFFVFLPLFFFGCFDLFMIGKVPSIFLTKEIKKDLNSQCIKHMVVQVNIS